MSKEFEYDRVELPNGLTILFNRRARLPLLSINAFVKVGKDQNPPNKPGLAALTARLLDEGTLHYTADQLSELIENQGGELSTFSERELTAVCLQTRSTELRTGLGTIAEMLRSPVFAEERVKAEKSRVTNHIRAMDDDPQIVGSQLLNQCVYRHTPLAPPVLGTPESIAGFKRDDLIEFHSTRYGPQNTILAIVGDSEIEEILPIVKELFGGWTNESFELNQLPYFERQAEPLSLSEIRDKEQVNVFLGHLGAERKNPDYYALQVLDIILGGGPGFSSRIPRRLRDELGLAYVTYADISGSCGLYPGRFVAYIGTSPEKLEKAISGLLNEIRQFQSEGVTQQELRMAQDFLTGSFVFEFQSLSSMARFLMMQEVFSLERDYLQKYKEYIWAVNQEEVLRVARQYLDPLNYSTVLVGPVS